MASLCISSVLTKIIKTGYAALQLEYFFTAGPDEVRAWTIRVSAVIIKSSLSPCVLEHQLLMDPKEVFLSQTSSPPVHSES